MPIPGVVASGYYVTSGITGLMLPGTAGNYASTPDSNDLDITGDLTLMFDGAFTDWTPAATTTVLSKSAASGHRSYQLSINSSTGLVNLLLSAAGTTLSPANSSVAPTVADGAFLAIGVTWRASDGRVQFWTAPTGTTTAAGGVGWTQLGTDKSIVIASIFASDAILAVGATSAAGSLLNGKVKRARVWASIDGSDQRFDADFTTVTILGTRNPTTLVESAKSATVTMNGSAWDWAA